MVQQQLAGPFSGLFQRLLDYFPTFAVGLLLLVLGIALGWIVKRAVVRVLIWLRLDRLGGRVGWRAAFGKGDVRAALYNLLGGIAMFLVILVFLDNALQILGLTVLSRLVDNLVIYLPNLGLVGLIVGVGVLIANAAAHRAEELFEEEELAHGRLIGKVLKGVLLSGVGAIALWQLNIAREIVLSAFLIAFGAMGLAFAMGVGLGSARAIQRGWEVLFQKRKEN
jgi:Mechanosensitive ion channel, conserved TM helix